MRAVVQRVNNAQVVVNDQVVGHIKQGLLVYLGVQDGDTEGDAVTLADKFVHLRIFSDPAGKMNRSIQDIGGSVLLISQFTLCGDCRKGRRPGFDQAANPALANTLYQRMQDLITEHNVPVQAGIFAAHMYVTSVNDGPVTFLLDSRKAF
jgi:D-tyrosyl-tRNA(Tyr) deacylase